MKRPAPAQWSRAVALVFLVVGSLAIVPLAAGPSGATAVGDEAALRGAVTDASQQLITLTADVTLTCAGGGALVRDSATPLSIVGQGHWVVQQCVGANLLTVTGSGGLALTNIALQAGGDSTIETDTAQLALNGVLVLGGNQHAIRTNSGAVVVERSYIFAGSVDGVYSSGGTVSLVDSIISGGGGGIVSDGDVTVVRSTIYFVHGDGLNGRGDNTVVNSTIAYSFGSGIVTGGTTLLVYSTVVDNSYPNSGGFNLSYGGGGGYVLQNTMITRSGSGAAANCQAGATKSNGYNFSDDSTCGLTDATDKPSGGNPLVEPGAFPPGTASRIVFVPQPGSPLVDAIPLGACQVGPANGITTDELANPRPAPGGGCDIGAFEVQPDLTEPAAATAVVVPPTFPG